jgi:hypothetical protein
LYAPAPAGSHHYADPRRRIDRPHIDPLSAERYRIVFTADADLKQKLELARDLMRHSHPSGDFAPIVSRALDLLLQELLRRRFGARRKDTPKRVARSVSRVALTSTSNGARQSAAPPAPVLVEAPSDSTSLATASPDLTVATTTADTPHAPITRVARRAVLERDGLGCCWLDAEGHRCGSNAWLEHDHRHPSGKGGSSAPENLRLLCRAHNRFAAERAYGRDHIERAIQARQRGSKQGGPSGQPPASSPAPA